jgi:hypothetical protein
VLATVVEWGDLLDLIWSATLAGIGVTCVFAIAVLGATRAVDLQRDGRGTRAAVYGLVAVLSLTVFAGAVVLGIIVMTSK